MKGRFLCHLTGLLLAVAVIPGPSLADSPLAEPTRYAVLASLKSSLDTLLAASARPSHELLADLKSIQVAVRDAGPVVRLAEEKRLHEVLDEHIDPALFALLHAPETPPSPEVVQNLEATRAAVTDMIAHPPCFAGLVTIGKGERSWRVDLGRVFDAIGEGSRRVDGAGGAATGAATDAQVEVLKRLVESGQVPCSPNLQLWFRYQYPPTTPEAVADRVAALMKKYLGRPENLADLAPGLGLGPRGVRRARMAGWFLKALRWCGVNARLPGGDPGTIASVRDEILEFVGAFEGNFAIVWGQLNTAVTMMADGDKTPEQVRREMLLSFADFQARWSLRAKLRAALAAASSTPPPR